MGYAIQFWHLCVTPGPLSATEPKTHPSQSGAGEEKPLEFFNPLRVGEGGERSEPGGVPKTGGHPESCGTSPSLAIFLHRFQLA